MLRNFLINVIRDNEFVNSMGRRLIKLLSRAIPSLNKLTTVYRTYGTVTLNVCNVDFRIYSRADDLIANDLYYSQAYENGELRLLKELIKRSRHMIDVGANTGIFSIFAASISSDLEVLSFEPHPSNYKRLLKNVSINNLSNIKTYACAVGPTDSQIELTVPADLSISTTSSANDGFTRNLHRQDYVRIPVRQIKLDDILATIPVNADDIIKIDVEYYELEVLKGAAETLRTKRPMVIIELLEYDSLVTQFPGMKNKISKNHSNEILEFLTNLNYHGYAIGPEGLQSISSDRNSRNFLFVSNKLSRANFGFDELSTVLAESRN
jgi:FkbM family methyltransferase